MFTEFYQHKPEIVEAVEVTPFNYVNITEWVGGMWEVQKTRPHVIQITIPNVFGNQKAKLALSFTSNVPFVNYDSLDQHIKEGTLENYDLKQYLEYCGDYIVKKGNRFFVMEKDDFENAYDRL